MTPKVPLGENTKRLAVLVSGTGTILEAMLRDGLPISLVLADRPCRGLSIASDHGVVAVLIDRHDFARKPGAQWDREGFTDAVTKSLRDHQIALVAMAGFMTIFSPSIFEPYENRILNTHPSLLPAFKGGHAVQDTLAAGSTQSGCTVHIATPELDSGHILAQETVPILPGDTADSLQERIKIVERKLYPQVIRDYLARL